MHQVQPGQAPMQFNAPLLATGVNYNHEQEAQGGPIMQRMQPPFLGQRE